MSDLRDWLRRNNFEQYADAFEANDIDLDILPELSERDLEQLGAVAGQSPAAVEGDRRARRRSGRQPKPADAERRRRRRRRAAPGHGAVLRHGRLDGAVGEGRSRTARRLDPALSGRRRRRDRALRRLRRQIHGRRRSGLFRFSPRLRGCGGTRRSRRDRHPGGSRRHRAARTARACRRGSASPPASSWSAKSSAPAPRRSAPSSAKPPISPRGCRRSRRRTPSWSASRRRICSADCSSSNPPASTN